MSRHSSKTVYQADNLNINTKNNSRPLPKSLSNQAIEYELDQIVIEQVKMNTKTNILLFGVALIFIYVLIRDLVIFN